MSKTEQYKADGRSAVAALREFLHYVIAHPEKFANREDVIKALRSQAGIVSLRDQFDTANGSITLTPMSLNTAKKYASLFLPKGFDELEALRTQAISAVAATKARPPGKITKEGLKQQKASLESEIETLINSNFNLLQCISIAMDALDIVRTESDAQQRDKVIRDTTATLKSALGINAPPFNTPITDNNVTPIGKGRARRQP